MSGVPPPGPGPSSPPATVARLIPGAVSPARLAALRTGAVMAQAEAAVVTLTGPGAVTAAQGLLTNDVDKPGDRRRAVHLAAHAAHGGDRGPERPSRGRWSRAG